MSGVTLFENDKGLRDGARRLVNRFVAAILSTNDTLADPDERERMRRTVLDSGELLERRMVDWYNEGGRVT